MIGWLLAVWLLTQGTNLAHYGLDPRYVLSKTREKNIENPEQYAFEVKQTQIRNEIEAICDELAEETDDIISYKLEQKIRVLENKLVKQDDELNSVDEMIRKAREKKKERMRNRRFQNRSDYHSQSQYNYGNVLQSYY